MGVYKAGFGTSQTQTAPSPTPEPEEPQPYKLRDGEERLEGPQFIKFESKGQELVGMLRGVQKAVIDGKPVVQYLLEATGLGMVKFNGTYDIVTKLKASHVGCYVRMKYLRDDQATKDKGNPIKIFDIVVSRPKANAHGVETSDFDLPEF